MPIQEMSQLLARIRQKVTSLVKRRTSVQALLSELYGRDIEVDRVAGLYESSAARISKIEQDNAALIEKMDALSRSFAAQAEIVNTRTRRADAGALSPLLSPAEIGQLQQQYAAMVSQRDALLNERDGLLVGLQQARRANGLEPLRARANKQRLAFPIQLLPEGRAPNIFVVDIGAQNLTHEEHAYQSLATAGPVKVTGFEPLADAARKRADSEPNVVMLNHFIGDGGAGIFHINRDDSTSSLLDSNIAFLERFEALSTMCSTIRREPVTTTRLDDVSELTDCDFLKIDVQGGELDVLKGAPTTLARAVVVHCEVEFSQLYTDQPLFGAIDEHLRSAGFELIDILNLGYATVKSLPRPIARSRLLWGEAVYMRAPDSILTLGPQKIIGAAYIAHVNYGMYDVAAEYLSILDRNGASNYANSYGAIVAAPDFELKSNVEIA